MKMITIQGKYTIITIPFNAIKCVEFIRERTNLMGDKVPPGYFVCFSDDGRVEMEIEEYERVVKEWKHFHATIPEWVQVK